MGTFKVVLTFESVDFFHRLKEGWGRGEQNEAGRSDKFKYVK